MSILRVSALLLAFTLPAWAAGPAPAAPDVAPMAAVKPDEAQALYERGLAYRTGDGVKQDKAEAVKLFLEAARRGNGPALYALGYVYDYGDGAKKDPVESYAWYKLAASALPPGNVRDAAAMGAERVAAKLTPEQRAEAEARIKALLAGG